MPLIVEDGTIVANANSYNSLVTIKAYAALRSRVLPDDDDVVTGYAIRAMDYLSTFGEQYKGLRSSALQFLDWPRSGVTIDTVEIDSDFMPFNLLSAQNQLVIEQANGVELLPTYIRDRAVKRKKIGPLETEWFDNSAVGILPTLTLVDLMLTSLLNQTFTLRTVRV